MRINRQVRFLLLGFSLLLGAMGLPAQGSLPTGWADQDVGTVGTAGSASYANGTFALAGAGATFFSTTSDAFHFAYQPLSGDGTIVARVVSTSNQYAFAGIMVRETLNANATRFMVTEYLGSAYSMYRITTGGTSAYSTSVSATMPYWIELVRSGNTFTGYMSTDRVDWVQVGSSETISMATDVYVGLAVTSGSTSYTYTGTLDNVSVSSSASPAPVISGISGTTGSVGEQVVISGSGFGASQGNSEVLLNGAATTIDSWSDNSITITIPTGATSGYLAVSVAPSMNDSNPVDFTVTANPLPSGWFDQDIGTVGKPGSAGYTSGAFTIAGAGGSLSSTASDAFHFAYQPLSGDGTIVARVVNTNSAYPQAAVMIRETLDADATRLAVIESDGEVYSTYRTTTGATSTYVADLAATLPYWIKVVRSTNTFTGYVSPDGISWKVVAGPIPIDMAQTAYVGLAVDSQSTSTLYTATFDNVSVTTGSNPAPQISSVSATTGSIGAQIVISGSGFGASQGTSAALLNNSSVTINSWSATSINITIPSGATSGYLVVALGPSMISSNAVYFTITSQPLPAGWLDQDVGVVGKTGNATFTNSVFTVQGAGGGITGLADGFHFVYQPLTTNGSIVARVVSQTEGSQAGVMVRETLDSDSADIFSYLVNSTGYMSSRAFQGSPSTAGGSQSAGSPYWVEVVRTANQFGAFISRDGTNWVQIGTTQTITTAESLYVGFGVSSGNTSSLATATFDNVSIGSGTSLANPVITGVSPTSGAPAQSVTISGSGFGATQGTSTVQFNGSTATATSWSDSEIVATLSDEVTTGPVTVTVGGITAQGPTFMVALTVQLTDSLGNQSSYTSSVNGGQWSLTTLQGSGCSSCSVRGNTQNEYDSNGNLLWTTDPAGNTTTYSYDSNGNMTTDFAPLNSTTAAVTTYTYNSFGEVLTMTDALGNETTNTYDSHGNLLTVTTPQPKSGTAASKTQFAYNSLGELTQITDPLNNVTTMTYTSAGYIASITDPQSNLTSYTYDSSGNRTSVTDALGHVTNFAYDAGNRLTQITYPDSTTASFTYDYRGRRITATDQNGKTTTYGYDDADRLTSVTDAAGNVTQYNYDTEDNLLSITDANGHVTNFAYDAFGRVTQTTFPSNYFETYAYDADNNLTSKTDRNGNTIQYVYDALNRLTQKNYPDSTNVEYTYDLVGKILSVNDPTGTYGFAYDNMGRLIGTTTQYSFLSGTNLTNSYTYDADSNRTGYTAPDGSTNTYTYDTLNRLSTLANSWAGSFGFSYDALSRRTQMTRPNGVSTSYSYDNLSRLISVLHQLSGSTIDGAVYTVDAAGNRTSKADELANVTTNYGYDSIYELLQATQGSTTTESYSYDPVGNRLSSLGVSSYTVNSSNELTATSNASYTYDYNGNTISKADSTGTTNYAWDYENRLSSVTLPNSGGMVTFKYDPFSRRIEKISPNATGIFAYDADNLTETVNSGGGMVARYIQGQKVDEPLAMERGTAVDYYEEDGLGSITSLTAPDGSLAQSYAYDSFGGMTNESGSLTNFFRYTAREFDTETNVYYYRARFYDQGAGRFLSEDPLRFAGNDINFYVYSYDGPTDSADPFGLQNGSTTAAPPPVAPPQSPAPSQPPIPDPEPPSVTPPEPEPPPPVAAPWLAGAIAVVLGVAAYAPSVAGRGEDVPCMTSGTKWRCTATCNLEGIGSNPVPYPRVTGTGTGNSQDEACLNAKRSATQAAPRGTYARHCKCDCSKR